MLHYFCSKMAISYDSTLLLMAAVQSHVTLATVTWTMKAQWFGSPVPRQRFSLCFVFFITSL